MNDLTALPDVARRLIDGFTAAARDVFDRMLVGVYLHGSAAMGCYNSAVSDLDFIVVIDEPMADAQRRAFMDAVVELDSRAPGKGIEMSVVTRSACAPFVHPAAFELHYSRMHVVWWRRAPEDYIAKMRGTDADLAAHFTVIRGRGACLFGAAIGDVFAPVPKQDYVDSIWADVCCAVDEITGNTMYLTLNLARVLSYLEDGVVRSKREGGDWALKRLPGEYRPLVEVTLNAYGGAAEAAYDNDLARRYAAHMLGRIQALRGKDA